MSKPPPQASAANPLLDLSRAYVKASGDYWSGCAELWGSYAKDLASKDQGEGAASKTARLCSGWAGLVQRSLETYLAAWPR